MHGSRHCSIGIICIEASIAAIFYEKVNQFTNEVTEMRRGFENILTVQELQMQQIAISVDPADYIAKRVRGLDGRPIIANKKFDYDRRTFVENKKDYDFEATFQEQLSNTTVHIDDVVLTGANLECLTKAYCYDDDKKSISPEIIDAFVEHYGHTKSGMEMHT
uniref:Uncharacterized protein n=1 Tax=Oryza barthii TaxID=65489 RepID=A0A0D3GFT1_9ORYZ